jgi:hypothetical protein
MWLGPLSCSQSQYQAAFKNFNTPDVAGMECPSAAAVPHLSIILFVMITLPIHAIASLPAAHLMWLGWRSQVQLQSAWWRHARLAERIAAHFAAAAAEHDRLQLILRIRNLRIATAPNPKLYRSLSTIVKNFPGTYRSVGSAIARRCCSAVLGCMQSLCSTAQCCTYIVIVQQSQNAAAETGCQPATGRDQNNGQRSLQLTRMLTKHNSRLLSVNHTVRARPPGADCQSRAAP